MIVSPFGQKLGLRAPEKKELHLSSSKEKAPVPGKSRRRNGGEERLWTSRKEVAFRSRKGRNTRNSGDGDWETTLGNRQVAEGNGHKIGSAERGKWGEKEEIDQQREKFRGKRGGVRNVRLKEKDQSREEGAGLASNYLGRGPWEGKVPCKGKSKRAPIQKKKPSAPGRGGRSLWARDETRIDFFPQEKKGL